MQTQCDRAEHSGTQGAARDFSPGAMTASPKELGAKINRDQIVHDLISRGEDFRVYPRLRPRIQNTYLVYCRNMGIHQHTTRMHSASSQIP